MTAITGADPAGTASVFSLSGGAGPFPSALDSGSANSFDAGLTAAGPASQPQGSESTMLSLLANLVQLLEQLMQSGSGAPSGMTSGPPTGPAGGQPAAAGPGAAGPGYVQSGAPGAGQGGASQPGAPQPGTAQLATSQPGAPPQPGGPNTPAPGSPAPSSPASGSPASGSSTPNTSAGSGPNSINITNHEDHPITVGKFKNGESATAPSAEITLQPGQSGTLHYDNGEAGFAAQADSSGKYQPTASRLEYEADKDGKMKYPDVSYIDGRNAAISVTDGAGLSKGDDKNIASGAPSGTITQDVAGNKTVAGWYDGSTAQMQAGGAFMQDKLGTSGAYLHPNDDTKSKDQNPMSGTQSDTLNATFGNA